MVQHMTAHTSYCNRVTEFSRAFVDIQPSAASKPSIRLAPLMEAVKDAGVEAGRSGMPTAKLTICKKVFRLRACHHVRGVKHACIQTAARANDLATAGCKMLCWPSTCRIPPAPSPRENAALRSLPRLFQKHVEVICRFVACELANGCL